MCTHGGRFERAHGDVFDAYIPPPLPTHHRSKEKRRRDEREEKKRDRDEDRQMKRDTNEKREEEREKRERLKEKPEEKERRVLTCIRG